MTAKAYLQQVKIKDAAIENLLRDKETLKEMLFSLGGCSDGEPVQTSKEYDKFGTIFAKIDEKERELTNAIEELMNLKLKISGQINRLNDERYIKILYKRYLQYQTFEVIAVDMGYSYQYIVELHGAALNQFNTTYKNLYNPK